MKNSLTTTLILLSMFFITQMIGLAVISVYSPQTTQVQTPEGLQNITTHNLPYGLEPPQDLNPKANLISIIIAFAIAILLIFVLMKFKAAIFLRIWFFFVVTLAIAITLNTISFKLGLPTIAVNLNIISFKLNLAAFLALLIALPLSFLKIFKRNIIIHNLTELLIYPGIAAIFVPLLNLWTIILLLIFISIYDMYMVWHVGLMQKMAKYQIQTLRVFSGFFIPYMNKKQKQALVKLPKSKLKNKKVKVNVAILGGGDVVFPIILAGVVLRQLGLMQAIIISIGAALALAALFFLSKKGKFYPAMPFITAGCFAALIIVYLFQ